MLPLQRSARGALFLFVIAIAFAFHSGCQSGIAPPAAPSAEVLKNAQPLSALKPEAIRIATFNIANLSLNKLAKPDVVAALVAIMRKYDVIAVQELDDASLRAPEAFLAAINRTSGDTYGVLFSAESGLDATAGEKEQYAFYFNTTTVEVVAGGNLFPDQSARLFVREPFAAQFRAKGGPSFVLLTIHTDPDVAPAEITALRQAVDWASATYMGEEGVVLLGDFNAGKSYVRPAEIARIRAQYLPFVWIVPDTEGTTLAARSKQAHDRIVVTGDFARRFSSTWGVDRSFSSRTVSDHFPVWAEFRFDHRE